MISIHLCSKTLSSPEVDVVVAPISMDKENEVGWYEKSDLLIQEVAGLQYHASLLRHFYQKCPMEGSPIFIRGNQSEHEGKFNHVVFIPFKKTTLRPIIIFEALKSVKENGCSKILFPLTDNWLSENSHDSFRILNLGLAASMELGRRHTHIEGSSIKEIDMEVFFMVSDETSWSKALVLLLKERFGE